MAEERKRRSVRYRTTAATLSDSRVGKPRKSVISSEKRLDRRIQRTRALLHEALGSLIREKAYDRITIAEVLDRAQVSRSTFYLHFRDKDDLLASGMRALLLTALSVQGTVDADLAERIAAFSLPLLTHIDRHRRSAKIKLGERGRAVLHEHLRLTLSDWIVQAMHNEPQHRGQARAPVDTELLARHIASTFVLILHWWLDHGGPASPQDADKLFRALVMPVLQSLRQRALEGRIQES